MKIKRKSSRFFLEEGLRLRDFNQATLKCITGNEVTRVLKEVHARDDGEHQGFSRLYKQIIHLCWKPMPPQPKIPSLPS